MFALILLVALSVSIVEITRWINNPGYQNAAVESIKYQPEWSHIHACGGDRR
jgi:hypothetical protein